MSATVRPNLHVVDGADDARAKCRRALWEHGSVACPECGSPLPDAEERLQYALERLQILEDNEVRLERKLKHLRKEVDKQMRASPHYDDAMEVLEHWRKLCHPNAKELEGERLKKVIARLSGKPKAYTKDELKRAVFGYSKFPYVIDGRRARLGTPAQRYIDAELVFRDPKHVDQGIALAMEAERRDRAMPEVAPVPDEGGEGGEPPLSPTGGMAIKLAEMGWHVFPVLPRDKRPMSNSNGLLDASIDAERIRRFWARKPDHNVAVRCGSVSQIFVLDVDGDAGYESLRELEIAHGELPKTLSVKTPSGGQHFYFRHPGGEIRNTAGFPGFGLDIRGDGGYVLAPPSVGANGNRYEPDERVPIADPPAWLVRMLLDYQRQRKEADEDNDLAKFFEGQGEGGRNNAMSRQVGKLVWAGHTKAEVLGHAIAINHEYCKPPLPDREVRQTVESIWRRDARRRQREGDVALQGLESQEAGT